MSQLRFDGWSSPDPEDPALSEALHRARYSLSRLTQSDAYLILAAAEAYLHFSAHPTSTESVAAQLRELRARVKRRRKAVPP